MDQDDFAGAQVYQLRVGLRGVSPPIWRRIQVSAEASIADLHKVIQAAMGWEDIHLHQFTIRGQWYGVPQEGVLHFQAGSAELALSAFRLQPAERFTYEYDFHARWLHDIRLEPIMPRSVTKVLPTCAAGIGACPPEDSGPPERFMERIEGRSILDFAEMLQEELEREDLSREWLQDVLEDWLPWVDRRFDRSSANARLLPLTGCSG